MWRLNHLAEWEANWMLLSLLILLLLLLLVVVVVVVVVAAAAAVVLLPFAAEYNDLDSFYNIFLDLVLTVIWDL